MADFIEVVKKMGAQVEMQGVCGVTHCKQHNIFSTPAWLDANASYAEVHEGIGKMIDMISDSID
jgi:enhancing lycopene biosynthesis protein 2